MCVVLGPRRIESRLTSALDDELLEQSIDLSGAIRAQVIRQKERKLQEMIYSSAVTSQTESGIDKPFTIQDLHGAMEKIASLPPQPKFAVTRLLPRDRGFKVVIDGEHHFVAHPSYWDQIPLKPSHSLRPPTAILGSPIVDLDAEENRDKLKAFLEVFLSNLGREGE
jgi:hypothetical protein